MYYHGVVYDNYRGAMEDKSTVHNASEQIGSIVGGIIGTICGK